uniref:Biotin carboxyl carrier protein of acetyl-CoA carboxylase n=1 Tax=Eucheuma denticulatum TaxID=305493 RepID=A0A8E7UEQ6_9FLOR|nr:acetyl-CoA carboxylase biotin carboxyl carrier protein [Eucheuma denticulatum]
MKFQTKDLKKFLHSIKKHNINEVNIQSHGFRLTINTLNNIIKSQKNNVASKIINENKNINSEHMNSQNLKNHSCETYFTIVSPMVGTFYRSPAPNEPPFIKLYDLVKKNQTVCIIEAMKLMNEIESEVDGEIVEVLVQDGDIIDCGQALMKVKPIDTIK